MKTPPVLIIAFNRPEHTSRILEAVKNANPSKIYLALDGPRQGNHNDELNRQTIIQLFDGFDWNCEVEKLIRTDNLGCKIAVSSAITWFFDHEEQGIILEDDCLPSKDFFMFCGDMLERYKNEKSVMQINGVNYQNGQHRGNADYYFSKIPHVWGWATWRRAWKFYDMEMQGLEQFFAYDLYRSIINYKNSRQFWEPSLTMTKEGKINTWDYQWVFSIWKNNGLVVMPNYNLISNIGFDELATHTTYFDKNVANKPFVSMPLVKTYTDIFVNNYVADAYSFNTMFKYKSKLDWYKRAIKNKIIGIFKMK